MRKLALIFLSFLFVTGCVTYNKMWVGPTSVFDNQEFKENISKKEVYVHDPSGNQFSVQAPELSDSTLLGTFVLLDTVEVKEELAGQDLTRRNQVHFYTRKDLSENNTVSMINRDEVKEIAVYDDNGSSAEQDKKVLGAWFAALLVTMALIVGFTIWAINALFTGLSVGCYIATMVYGSYDAPEVMTLRNFRDEVLKKNLFGRAFINVYYLTSPGVVSLTKNSPRINRFFKKRLDKFVDRLRSRGIK